MTTTSDLSGRRVGITADRRWEAQAELLERLGAEVIHGPTLRTVDLSRDEALRRATADLIAVPPDYLVATTGMGIGLWLEAADAWGLGGPLRDALRRSRVVARGAKARVALLRQDLPVGWTAPSETMDEIVAFLTGEGIGSARLAVQLFDPGGHPATAALAARAGEIVEVPVYRWLLPDDTGPARRLIGATCAGAVDAVTFTSQPAVHHLFRIADAAGRAADLRAACNTTVLAVCVGPVCAEAARAEGVTRPVWPDPPRLAPMIRLVASRLRAGSPSVKLPRGNTPVPRRTVHMGDISSRDELATIIEGRSDDEISAAVAERGTDKVLAQIFEGWAGRFDPNRAGGQSAVIGFDITSPDGTHQYQLKVADGSCQAVSGAPDPARVTLGLAVPDLLRLVTGKLDGMQAFMTGKLKLSGDMMFAQTMQSWFTQ